MDCIICAYPIDNQQRLHTVGVCNHSEICSICFLRIRSLQRNFECPTCKQHLERVIVTEESSASFSDFELWGDNINNKDSQYDQKSQMFFPRLYYQSYVQSLWLSKCCVCQQTKRDMKALRTHMTSDHKMQICQLCVDNKFVFPSEHKSYTQAQFENHLKVGDGDGSKGHPMCEFCRTRFYDAAQLFTHLSQKHETCHICEKQGIKYKYYQNYPDLENHYRKNHFICEERSCLEAKFIVFANEIDLINHNLTVHNSSQAKRTTIPIHFSIRRNNHESDYPQLSTSSSNNPNRRYEGGLGGRIHDGEWQVEFQSVPIDPREALRNPHQVLTSDEELESTLKLLESIQKPQRVEKFEDGLNSEESFPALPTTSTSGGNMLINKWVTMGGAGNNQTKGNNNSKGNNNQSSRKHPQTIEDYPVLPSSSSSSTKLIGNRTITKEIKKLSVQPNKVKDNKLRVEKSSSTQNLHKISNSFDDYPALQSQKEAVSVMTSSSSWNDLSPSTNQNVLSASLSDWARIKIKDKKVKPKETATQNYSQAYEYSLQDYLPSPPNGFQVEDIPFELMPKSPGRDADIVDMNQVTNKLNSTIELTSESAFPSLPQSKDLSNSSQQSTVKSNTTKYSTGAKKVNNLSKSSAGIGSLTASLKAVGIEGNSFAKSSKAKIATGLTVVKANSNVMKENNNNDKKIVKSDQFDTVLNLKQLKRDFAEPSSGTKSTADILLYSTTPNSSHNQRTTAINETDRSTQNITKEYPGWVTIGGAGTETATIMLQSEDFPDLLSSSSRVKLTGKAAK